MNDREGKYMPIFVQTVVSSYNQAPEWKTVDYNQTGSLQVKLAPKKDESQKFSNPKL